MDESQVRRVAELARLKLSDQEIAAIGAQLGRIIEYVDVLNEVNTDDVDPMVHAVELRNTFRADDIRESLAREDALANAPQSDGTYFLVPDILQRDDS